MDVDKYANDIRLLTLSKILLSGTSYIGLHESFFLELKKILERLIIEAKAENTEKVLGK